MQKLNQQPDICPYFSPEFKVIPQYIIMKEGECMELNNRTTSFFGTVANIRGFFL